MRLWTKFRLRRRSVVLTWLLSYMAVLLLPVVISIIVYNSSSKTLESEIHQANDAQLKQLREIMDNQFQSMERLSFEMTWNVKVQDLLYSNKYRTPNEDRYDLFQVTQDLKLYKSSYPFLDSFYIYYAADDMLLLPAITRDSKLGYDLTHEGGSMSYEQWSAILKQKSFKGFIPMPWLGEDGHLRQAVAYVSTYAAGPGEKPIGTNVILLDEARILGPLANMQFYREGQVMILNKDNQVLVSSNGDAAPANLPYSELNGNEGLFYFTKDGEKMEGFYIHSARADLKYVSVIPSRLYWKKAEQVRNLTYMSILISVVGGVILTYFFLRKNYVPVRELMQTFAGKTDAPIKESGNEFHFIQESIHHTLREMDKFTTQMKQQHHVLRSNFIGRLLKGKLDSQVPVDEALTAYHMQPLTQDYAVMLLYVDERGPFFERIEGMEVGDKHMLLQFIVTNVVEELAGRKHRGYAVEIDETFACLINFSAGTEEERRGEMMSIAKEAQSFLLQRYHIHLTLSISGTHTSISGISRAYSEALEAMEYKLVMGSDEILAYPALRREEEQDRTSGYYYPLSVEQQWMNSMKIGDLEQAKRTLDDIIERNFRRHPALPVPLAKCLLFNLASTMIKTTSEMGDEMSPFLRNNPKSIERLMACETVKDMQLQLNGILEKVCAYTSDKRQQNIQQARQQALQSLVERVTAFIGEHYQDVNLNISMIGEHLDMKATYVSKLFKDQTGGGLLDYINKVRIENAKTLIAEHQRSITDVASLVGFNDPNAFIRTFKKYEGITPGKYKETVSV
ncbi:helix-turn-helix domain-containing protein [Paenibacillus doosanensis]|uniref:HTH-type transcriptional regulator YesS n=1 Tax=Paenibacillus konkukensis TaxID=2020716 RepID=A0ABY4RTH2_9BACL|nr:MULTISPECIES: helix-turn-helix domain-containing protein [Paenibacillus]MCS7464362.1 helix-turn-helix domain-containing protein [Paenibacillus doosanensis]UQZ85869.1 HTH-type transcriptional regulator YesS [Paenibacillus konkukensis]